ncbi:MAG TPA: response regulator, partial [Spirochaetota bacterium]|nr:response regulator [Spirochaetota bacterium]
PEKKIKILVAEDNETNQRLINILLTKLGYDVDIAEDGKKAVNMAKNKDYDAILMDVQMPNMNGYEATQILRSEGIKIPIISVTANAFKEDVEASLESGMNDHITKPYRKEEIIATIEKWTKN